MTSPHLPTDPAEPHLLWRTRPLFALFRATRPAFLTITLAAVLLGFALAGSASNAPSYPPAVLVVAGLATLLIALLAHAAANVINDACDTDTDAVNLTRLFPFTGGSRFVQNGVFTPSELWRLATGLVTAATLIGALLLFWLTQTATAPLTPLAAIASAGFLLLWGYSAPPLRFAARGWGEIAIALAWSLVVAGSATLMAALFDAPLSVGHAWLCGLPFGLLVANILYINQFPDAPADALVGKRTWPVRLGRSAIWGYPLIALLAALTHLFLVLTGLLPLSALTALLPLAASASATRRLFAFARSIPPGGSWSAVTDFRPLLPAIVATLAAAHGYALLLALVLGIARLGADS